LEFYPADCWELGGYSAATQAPEKLTAIDWMSDIPFNYHQTPLHKTRVLVFKGKEIPYFMRAYGRGWGMSVLESFIRSLNQNLKNQNVIYELLDEAKTSVFGLKEFNDDMQDPDATNAVLRRLTQANQAKNYLNALVMDSEDKFEQKQIHFSGLAELENQNRINLAGDANRPETKLFGIQSTGFNSGGADIENYNDFIESEIRPKMKNIIIKSLQYIGRVVLGKTLDFDIEWAPLKQSTPMDDQKIRAMKFDTLLKAFMAGILTNGELIKALNKDNLLNIEIMYKEKIAPHPEMGAAYVRSMSGK
jgi:phage-related protein (TIGR01555 family)